MVSHADITASPETAEIETLYEQIGLATADSRARFQMFQAAPKQATPMTVVISSTSQPFG